MYRQSVENAFLWFYRYYMQQMEMCEAMHS